MLSGIGPAAQLSQLGIPVVLDKPGRRREPAGSSAAAPDLQGLRREDAERDLSLAVRPRRHGARLCAAPARAADHGAVAARRFHALRSGAERANIQFHVQPLSLDKFGDPLHPFPAFTASVANVRPTSRGALTLRSADPAETPVIRPNYLSTPEDRRVAADSIRVARRIVAQPALQKYSSRRAPAGRQVRDDDEAALVKAAGDIGTTIFHPVGTAKMGRDDDAAGGGGRAAARDRHRSACAWSMPR